MSNKSKCEVTAAKLAPPHTEFCQFGPWKVSATKSHIMGSKCATPLKCEELVNNSSEDEHNADRLCEYCRFGIQVQNHHLPDMIFNNNMLRLEHSSGGAVEFSALDALRHLRDKDKDNIQVAHAKEWKEARKECEHSQNVMDGYDWTYTTDYSGTLLGGIRVEPSTERIDIEKLKTKEPIRFFQELYLYEDELDDNGATNCVVKIRIMDSGFLVLLRHYLRVDHVKVRCLETRLYHAAGTDHIVREQSRRELSWEELEVPVSVAKCPDEVSCHLTVRNEVIDRLVLPVS